MASDLMEIRQRILQATPHLETASGNPVTFGGGVGAPLQGTVATINPVQNFNRRNLLSSYRICGLRHDTYTHNAVTYTANEDGSVTANGTPSADSYWSVSFSLPPGDYYYSYGDLRNAPSQMRNGIIWESGAGISRRARKWDGVSQTDPGTAFANGLVEGFRVNAGCTYTIRVRVSTGVKAEDFVFYPSIFAADETDYSFESYKLPTPDTPYPIFGLTELTASNNGTVIDTLTFSGTEYGGTFDYDSGVYTRTRAMATVDNNKAISTVEVIGSFTRFWSTLGVTIDYSATNTNANYFCDCLPPGVASYGNNNHTLGLGFSSAYPGSAWFKMPTSLVGSTATSIKAYLAEHPIHLVIVLATPVTTQYTPRQLKSAWGNNRISTNGDNLSFEYWRRS